METIGGANGGGRGCVVNEVVVVVGMADQYGMRGLGIWDKNPKPSGGGGGSVLGVPVETGGGGDGGGNLGVGNDVVVVVGTAN